MKKPYLLNKTLLILFFIFLEIILILFIKNYYDNERKKILEQNSQHVHIQFDTINNALENLADTIFKGYIDRDTIKESFKNKDRKGLLELLSIDYQYLKTSGVKQLHFHLPDNSSFLRLHKTEKYGDDLSKIRYSVAYVNKYHKKISGFETGKVLPGLRNVYPLFIGEEYLGSVEISFGIEFLERNIEDIYNLSTHFLINKEKFDGVVFKEDRIHYKESLENKKYVELIRKNEDPLFQYIKFDEATNKLIDTKTKANETFNFE